MLSSIQTSTESSYSTFKSNDGPSYVYQPKFKKSSLHIGLRYVESPKSSSWGFWKALVYKLSDHLPTGMYNIKGTRWLSG